MHDTIEFMTLMIFIIMIASINTCSDTNSIRHNVDKLEKKVDNMKKVRIISDTEVAKDD